MPYIPPAGVSALARYTGTFQGPLPEAPVIRADRINPITQEFESLIADWNPVDAMVIEALWRVRGSGAVLSTTGSRFTDVKKLDTSAVRSLQDAAREALARVVQLGYIVIKRIVAVTGEDWAEVTVTYINKRASGKQERSYTLNVRRP